MFEMEHELKWLQPTFAISHAIKLLWKKDGENIFLLE